MGMDCTSSIFPRGKVDGVVDAGLFGPCLCLNSVGYKKGGGRGVGERNLVAMDYTEFNLLDWLNEISTF